MENQNNQNNQKLKIYLFIGIIFFIINIATILFVYFDVNENISLNYDLFEFKNNVSNIENDLNLINNENSNLKSELDKKEIIYETLLDEYNSESSSSDSFNIEILNLKSELNKLESENLNLKSEITNLEVQIK